MTPIIENGMDLTVSLYLFKDAVAKRESRLETFGKVAIAMPDIMLWQASLRKMPALLFARLFVHWSKNFTIGLVR